MLNFWGINNIFIDVIINMKYLKFISSYISLPYILLIYLLMAGNISLSGQSKVNFLEGNITINQPIGFFSRNITSPKIGFEAGYLRQIQPKSPLFWGVSGYYLSLGSSGTFTIAEQLDFNLVNFDYRSTSNLLGFNGKMRFYPNLPLGKTEFYAEALLGYKWLYTTTNKTLSSDSESSDTHIEKGNLSLTYGVGAGINYPISPSLYFNIRGNYLPGLSKTYYVLNQDKQIKTTTLDMFDLKKSTTDLVRWDIGVTWRFSASDFE